MVRLRTTAARLSIVKDTHTGIKEASNTGLIPIIGSSIRDFDDRTFFNLIGTEDPELDTHHGLDIRIWTMNTCGHLFSVVVGGF
jgi:hypothetical protein